MQELIAKIEKLRKTLAAMKPKSAGNSLVPALKPPTVKPLSISPASTAASKPKMDIPGISPSSNKDPVKMAEQLKNPRPKKPKIEILKVDDNGQWMLKAEPGEKTLVGSPVTMKTPSVAPAPHVVNAKTSGFGYGHHSPEQNKLVEGLNFSSAKPINDGVNDALWMTSNSHPHTTVVKNAALHPNRQERGHVGPDSLDSAHREVLYHNMAHNFFDMGKYVPTTAGFHKDDQNYSAQKKINDASHAKLVEQPTGKHLAFENPNHGKVISNLHDSGELHKLAMMDHIMGHHDRHRKNYMVDDKGSGLHLIDNGTAFDYPNFDPKSTSHFHDAARSNNVEGMGKKDEQLHPEAKKWLMNLDPNKAAEIFANHSYQQDAPHVKGFITRLKNLQDKVKKGGYGNVERLLSTNRLSSGPMHEHHSRKEAA